eukprot:scaffold104215_cov45-Phaeocystis_antarctica.AAC.1
MCRRGERWTVGVSSPSSPQPAAAVAGKPRLHNAETAASKLLHEGCWAVTEFQKRWLTVVTLTKFGIHLISREHENEK